MYFAVVVSLTLSLFATGLLAQCRGADLRGSLSEEEQRILDERLHDMPYAEGLYWTASRGDQVMHLVGTVHMDDPRLDRIMAALAPVIRRADLVLVEATEAEEARLAAAITERPDLLFLTDGPTLPEMMSETDWRALRHAAESRGIPGFMAAKFQPWYLTMMLSLPSCAMQTLSQGERGLDARVLETARSADIPARALEPYDTLFTVMSRDPLPEQVRLLTLGTLPDPAAEDGLATLLGSYFEEKTGEILEVTRATAGRYIDLTRAEIDRLFDAMLDSLLIARNLEWMGPILATEADTVVIAVGAGHLPGEPGLLKLLADEGFTLERQGI